MRKYIKISLYSGVAILHVFAISPAYSQDSSEVNPSDIIVTARRTEERLQDVPISITVFSQEQISKQNITTSTDLAAYTPSLSVNQRYGPEKATFAIRGFVQETSTAPSVGVYFADVVTMRAQGGTDSGGVAPTGSFMDLQSVQVLKGPQGTLFGRNTTGGAVLLVPNKPTDRLGGYVEGSIGDYNMRRVQGVLNVPLADTFKVRIAADRNTRDGYIHNKSGIGPKDYNDLDYFAVRLGILADLTPDLENYTLATYSQSDTHGYGAKMVACNRAYLPENGFQITSGADLVPGVLAPAACAQIDRQKARGDGPLDVDINNPNPFLHLKTWQVINTTTWRASDSLTIKNIASYGEFRERSSFNLYGDNLRITNPAPTIPAFFGLPPLTPGSAVQFVMLNPAPGQDNSAESAFTEELQLQGESANGRLKWQAGGYLEMNRPIGFNAGYSGILLNCTIPSDLACTNPIFLGQISASSTQYKFDSRGLYAQATFDLTDKLSVTGGLRYTWDKVDGIGQDTRLTLLPTGGFLRRCNDILRYPSGTPGQGRIVSSASECQTHLVQKSSRPTWLIDVDYKPVPDVMLYAKYARGYRQGGINFTLVGFETWQPEKVESYEVGAKTSFRGGGVNGYFNIAGFYNDFTDQQLVANGISNVPGFSGAGAIVNAGKSRIQGVEVDGSVTLFQSLRFDLGYTYLDTKLESFTPPPIPPGAPYSTVTPTAAVGQSLSLSPKNRLTLSANYTLPLDKSIGDISLGATYVHTDKQIVTQSTLPELRSVPATDLLNLNVTWNKAFGQPVDLAFFMTNVTNQIYPVSVGSSYFAGGYENQLFGPPRMYGFRLRWTFGG